MIEKDGGQAFPQPVTVGSNDDMYPAYPGMTLRDYFAGQALAGMLDFTHSGSYEASPDVAHIAAKTAYQFANAMLLARQSNSHEETEGKPFTFRKDEHGRRFDIFELGDYVIIPAKGPGPIAIAAGKDHAAFIVKACNAHEELVEALRSTTGYMRNAKIDLETGTRKQTTIDTLNGGLRMAEAALSKVEGSTNG